MDIDKILFEKNEIHIVKQTSSKTYKLTFSIENAGLNLLQVVNPNLFKLIYDLNLDLFEKISIDKRNECESIIFILFKDLFTDIGLNQYYYYFHINHVPAHQQFIITPLCATDIPGITKNMECIDLKQFIMQYSVIHPHKIEFKLAVQLDNSSSPIIEKIICNIIYKIFNRVKQFVYTIRI
jgi:hypothetical protein